MRGGPEHEAGRVAHGGGRGSLVEAVQQEGRHGGHHGVRLRRAQDVARGEAAQREERAMRGGGRGVVVQCGERGIEHAGEQV